jgi:hypothetical protein
LAIVVLVLVAASLVIPGSPLYLPNWLVSGGFYEGRSARSWIGSLNDPDAASRRQAIFALGAMGNDGAAAVPALATILTEDEESANRSRPHWRTKMAPASKAAAAGG